jgi:hypothetical protein
MRLEQRRTPSCPFLQPIEKPRENPLVSHEPPIKPFHGMGSEASLRALQAGDAVAQQSEQSVTYG